MEGRWRIALMASFLVSIISTPLIAQPLGVIQGRVIDSISGEPTFGVTVIVQGENKFAQTDFDGKYRIQLPPGQYTVTFQMVGFETRTRQVTVEAGQAVSLNVTMGTPPATEAEVVVTGRSLNNTEAALLALQKKAPNVSDGISQEAVAKSPDSDAGEVLQRVTGITVIEGKYVFVRGLGERYSNTVLNDTMLPSPDPEKRVVPMDLFPASLIKNIRVIKTFMPEDPAEFSGGLVKVETREYPDEFEMSIGIGLGMNSLTTRKQFKSLDRGGNDYLGLGPNDFFGFGSDRWGIPEVVDTLPDRLPFEKGDTLGGLPVAFVQFGAAQFPNDWTPKEHKAPYDRKLSFSIGDSKTFENGMRFGYIYGTSYSRKWRKTNEEEFRYESQNAGGLSIITANELNYLIPQQLFSSNVYTEEVLWGNNLNLALDLGNNQQLTSKTFYSTQSEKEFRETIGNTQRPDRLDIINETSQYTASEIMHQMFGGKHAVQYSQTMRPHLIEWHLAFAEARRDQPDLRSRSWNRSSGTNDPFLRLGNDGRRFFSETEDYSEDLKVSYEVPFEQWSGLQSKVKVGYQAIDRTKDFRSRSFFYIRGAVAPGIPETWPIGGEATFHPARLFSGEYEMRENNGGFNAYDASQKLHAYFLQTEMPLLANVRFAGGVRVEDSFQKTRTYNTNPTTLQVDYGCNLEGDIGYFRPALIQAGICDRNNNGVGIEEKTDILPSINLTWEAVKDMNIRAAYTETVSRPDLRELSEFAFTPYFGAERVRGNANLDRTYIHNYDLRWEWYLSGTEYVGAGVFLKTLSSPIELVGQPVGGDGSRQYAYSNAQKGEIRGLELDFRKRFLQRIEVETNLFFIKSRVEVQEWLTQQAVAGSALSPLDPTATLVPTSLERRLQGQSDFVYNIKALYYIDKEETMSAGFFYNYFSDRIEVAGSEGEPDVIEKGTGILDLVFQWQPNENWNLKASVENILNAKYESTQEVPISNTELPFRRYRPGTNYSISASYKF
tara:strand:- start:118556 stop:121561 length:3006 start_codon:yes stop_codon:yes gene_type:complete